MITAQQQCLCSVGNKNILKSHKLALFCSVKCTGNLILKIYDLAKSLRDKGITVISGFHSPIEQEVLNILLKGTQPIIICPARSIENMRIPAAWKPALEKNRTLVLSPFAKGNKRMTEANAVRRNKFVADIADSVFVAYAAPGGKTESFCRDVVRNSKPLYTFDTPDNQNLIDIGAKSVVNSTWPDVF
jgi:predicted Rossmann fold nucleotide-binding protein DprA/Smf involved in DNA uptake